MRKTTENLVTCKTLLALAVKNILIPLILHQSLHAPHKYFVFMTYDVKLNVQKQP
jgi:hypothetical protein